MNNEKLELKNLDYDGYIYYNGKRSENTKLAQKVKSKKVDYFVLLENNSFYSEFCVTKKDHVVQFEYFKSSFNKDPEFIMKELSKKYKVINIHNIALHITENEKSLNYIKDNYTIIDEKIERDEEDFSNGKTITNVNLTIDLHL